MPGAGGRGQGQPIDGMPLGFPVFPAPDFPLPAIAACQKINRCLALDALHSTPETRERRANEAI